MPVAVRSKVIKDAIRIASSFGRSVLHTLPTMEDGLIFNLNGGINLRTNNMETDVSICIDNVVTNSHEHRTDLQSIVSKKTIKDLLANINEDTILLFDYVADTNAETSNNPKLLVESQDGLVHYEFNTYDDQAYEALDHTPNHAKAETDNQIQIKANVLSDVLDKVLFAVSRDYMRPALTGVKIEIYPDHLIAVASDAKILSYVQINQPFPVNRHLEILLHQSSVQAILGAIQKHTHEVALKSDGNTYLELTAPFYTNPHAETQDGSITIRASLMNESYPDYKPLIPNIKSMDKHFSVSANDLHTAIKRLCSVAESRKEALLSIIIEQEHIHITSSDMFSKAYGKETVRIFDNTVPSVTQIVAVGGILNSVIENLPNDIITFYISDPNKPVLAKSAEDSHDLVHYIIFTTIPTSSS